MVLTLKMSVVAALLIWSTADAYAVGFKSPVKLPKVKLPSIKLPKTPKLPSITKPKPPKVKLPAVSLPPAPTVKLPEVKVPIISLPEVKVPEVKLPAPHLPNVKWEQLDPSQIKWEQVDPGKIKWEQIDPSKIKWEQIDPSKIKWSEVDLSKGGTAVALIASNDPSIGIVMAAVVVVPVSPYMVAGAVVGVAAYQVYIANKDSIDEFFSKKDPPDPKGGDTSRDPPRNAAASPRPHLPYPAKELPTGGEFPYIPPKVKGNPEIVRNPEAGGGFLDQRKNVWEWAKDQHGGPHWDVQHPDGTHSNVWPTGKMRK